MRLDIRYAKKDTIIELNACDTTDLMFLRGIGRYTALWVIRYREQLGGYYSLEQTREARYPIADSIYTHLTIDTTLIRRIAVNRTGAKQLARHPYIRFEQAQAIYELRVRRRSLRSIDDLIRAEILTDTEAERLRPYLDFGQ